METACPLVFSNPILLRSSGKLHVHTHTHTHTYTSTTHSPQKSEGILIRYVDGSLFQRARRQDFQRLDMDVDTPRGETHTRAQSAWHLDPYLYRNAPNGVEQQAYSTGGGGDKPARASLEPRSRAPRA